MASKQELEKGIRLHLYPVLLMPASMFGYKRGDERVVSLAASAYCSEDGYTRVYAYAVLVGWEKESCYLRRLGTYKHTLSALRKMEQVRKQLEKECIGPAAIFHTIARELELQRQRD